MIRFLSLWNWIGFGLTLLFWGAIAISHRVLLPWELATPLEKGASAVTYGFLLGDLLYSLPLLFLAARGLALQKSWGWMSAQMANALWVYSMTLILIRDGFTRWSPGSVLFIPFLIIAIISIPWLWKNRSLFGVN
jgi:hypothetical protein